MTEKLMIEDKHALYLASVQDPLSDVQRMNDIFMEVYDKAAMSLREDFSGTFALSCCFVQSARERSALALDIDEEALSYGKKNYLAHLTKGEQERLTVLRQNSISTTVKVDLIAAFNFSYCLIHKRSELVEYFRHCHASLNDKGLLILDIFGGSDSEIPEVQERHIDNSDYIAPFLFEFVREDFNPVNRLANYTINFKYDEGPQLLKAFHYHFRHWSIPELRDCLEEAGFSKSLVYWEHCDAEGYGNGQYYSTEEEENSLNWNSYIVGLK